MNIYLVHTPTGTGSSYANGTQPINADLAPYYSDMPPVDHAQHELRERLCAALDDRSRADIVMDIVRPFLRCQREALAAAHRNTGGMPPLQDRIHRTIEQGATAQLDAVMREENVSTTDWAAEVSRSVWSEVHPILDRLWATLGEQQELIDRLIRERDHTSSYCGATHPDYGTCVEHSSHQSAHWYAREPRRHT